MFSIMTSKFFSYTIIQIHTFTYLYVKLVFYLVGKGETETKHGTEMT